MSKTASVSTVLAVLVAVGAARRGAGADTTTPNPLLAP